MAVNKSLAEDRHLSLTPESVFIKAQGEIYDSMADEKKKSPKHAIRSNDLSTIGDFLEKNSGGYNRETLREKFSRVISPESLDEILQQLQDSDKILTDREGKICWVWNPELIKEIKENKKYASKWIR